MMRYKGHVRKRLDIAEDILENMGRYINSNKNNPRSPISEEHAQFLQGQLARADQAINDAASRVELEDEYFGDAN